MSKSKVLKLIVAILIAITLFVAFSQNAFALHKPIDQQFADTSDKSNATNTVSNWVGVVLNVAQVIGAGVAIIMLIVIGIQWVFASPSGKAQIAKTAKYYVIGAVLIFATVGLIQIVKNFAEMNVKNAVS